jgi:hypothetical protein
MTMRTCFCPLAVLLASPVIAAAQSDTLIARQRDLALALLEFSRGGGRQATVSVGPTDPRFPANLIPSGATVLGSSGTVTILLVAGSADAALAAYRTHLELTGWRRAVEHETREGFMSTPPEGFPRAFCRDSSIVFGVARPRTRDTTLLQVTYYLPYRGSPCDPRVQHPERRPALLDSEMPTLLPPPGSRTSGSGMSGGQSDEDAHKIAYARMQSPLTAREVVAHYADQLRRMGWTVTPAADDADVASVVVKKKDSRGRLMIGMLSDGRGEPEQHLLSFRLDLKAGPESPD